MEEIHFRPPFYPDETVDTTSDNNDSIRYQTLFARRYGIVQTTLCRKELP
ncbi:19477_t:CDS:1, partial [Gigaspora rosea]